MRRWSKHKDWAFKGLDVVKWRAESTGWQYKYLFIYLFHRCMHLCALILYRCSDTEADQSVVMATPSALAAKCLRVCVHVCKSVQIAWCCPMGASSSIQTAKAIRKLRRSDRELGGGRPRRPFSSEPRGLTGRETKQESPRNIIQGRTNKLTLCLSISLSHLGLFYSGMCPICFLAMSGDRGGGNKTAEKGTKPRRRDNRLRGRGQDQGENKWGSTRRREGQAKKKKKGKGA